MEFGLYDNLLFQGSGVELELGDAVSLEWEGEFIRAGLRSFQLT